MNGNILQFIKRRSSSKTEHAENTLDTLLAKVYKGGYDYCNAKDILDEMKFQLQVREKSRILWLPVDTLKIILEYAIPTDQREILQWTLVCKLFRQIISKHTFSLTLIDYLRFPCERVIEKISIRSDFLNELKNQYKCKTLLIRANPWEDYSSTHGIEKIQYENLELFLISGDMSLCAPSTLITPKTLKLYMYKSQSLCSIANKITPFQGSTDQVCAIYNTPESINAAIGILLKR